MPFKFRSVLTLTAAYLAVYTLPGTVAPASAGNINMLFLADVNGPQTTSYGAIQAGWTFASPTISSLNLSYTPADQGITDLAGFIVVGQAGQSSFVPALLINTDTTGDVRPLGLADGQLLLHPGNPANGSAAQSPYASADLRYTVPVTGDYDISAAFSELPGNNPTLDDVYIAGVPVGAPGASNTDPTYSLSDTHLTAGETVDFVVAPQTVAGNVYSESTGLFADVSIAVPLPKTVWGGAGLLGLIAVAKLRRGAAVRMA